MILVNSLSGFAQNIFIKYEERNRIFFLIKVALFKFELTLMYDHHTCQFQTAYMKITHNLISLAATCSPLGQIRLTPLHKHRGRLSLQTTLSTLFQGYCVYNHLTIIAHLLSMVHVCSSTISGTTCDYYFNFLGSFNFFFLQIVSHAVLLFILSF